VDTICKYCIFVNPMAITTSYRLTLFKNKLLYLAWVFLFGNVCFAQHDSAIIRGKFFRQNLPLRNALIQTNFKLHQLFNPHFSTYFEDIIKQGYQLTFFDDFDTFNTNQWRKGQPWGAFHAGFTHQYYDDKFVEVKNGYLYLMGAKEEKVFMHNDTALSIPYGVGLINSDISFKQQYGFFEIRCKMPEGPATWPAFWLTGSTRWPPEIDIFENYGGKTGATIHRQTFTVHWGVNGRKSRGFLSKALRYSDKQDTFFHTYACEWTPTFIKFYTDGFLSNCIKVNKKLRHYLDDEMVVILNNAFEPKYLPFLASNFKSNAFVVDWIRVYKK